MTPEIKKRIEQIRRGEVPEGYKKTKVGIVPCEWNLYRLSEISTEVHECAGVSDYETLSISAGIGFVNQAKKFGKEISGAQYAKYTVLHRGDFSYNKGNSKKYPQGCIYQLKDREFAAVPNVFESFRLTKGYNDYFEQLFLYGFLNSQLFSKINHGVRDDGLLNLRGDDFYSSYITFPSLTEQKRIAEILSAQDKVIALKEKLLEEKKCQKKALMQQLLTGKKRLPCFSGEWKKQNMSDILRERKEVNKDQSLRICSVAVNSGVVDQCEHLGKCMAASDTSNYNVVHYGDIVYTKSPTGAFPYGIVKQSQLAENVAVSPLYGVYEPTSYEIGYLLNEYFMYPNNANGYLLPIINKGAKNTINISNVTFITPSLYLPTDFEEIKKLVQIFKIANKEIQILQEELSQEIQKKKALMQLLLTGIVRVK